MTLYVNGKPSLPTGILCTRCGAPLMTEIACVRVHGDDILCPKYGRIVLWYCSEVCLHEDMEQVLNEAHKTQLNTRSP